VIAFDTTAAVMAIGACAFVVWDGYRTADRALQRVRILEQALSKIYLAPNVPGNVRTIAFTALKEGGSK
jgi:hypothetical protein